MGGERRRVVVRVTRGAVVVRSHSKFSWIRRVWSGRPCVIVGGGPSVSPEALDALERFRSACVISLCKSGERVPSDMHFAMDRSYWANTPQRFSWGPGPGAIRVSVADEHHDPVPNVDATLPRAGGDHWYAGWPETLAEGIACGGHSGFAALHLAYLLGADPIYLLGYDMRGENGRTAHWHEGYGSVQNARIYDRFRETLGKAAEAIGGRRRVVVLDPPDGPPSALDCFPHQVWTEVLG